MLNNIYNKACAHNVITNLIVPTVTSFHPRPKLRPQSSKSNTGLCKEKSFFKNLMNNHFFYSIMLSF